MNIIKKLVSGILATVMFCTLSVSTMATPQQSNIDMISETRDNIKFLEETTGKQYEKYTLGNEIPLYRVVSEDIVAADDMQIYPIYGGSDIIGIYEVYSNGSSSFGSSYSSKIDEVVKNGMTEFFLLTNGNEVYLSNGDNTELLYVESDGGMFSSEEYESTIEETIEAQKQAQAGLDSTRDTESRASRSTLDEQVNVVESVEFSELESMLTDISLEKNSDFSDTNEFELTDITPARTRAFANGSNYRYIKTGTYNQGNTVLCWAVSSMLIGEYVLTGEAYSLGNGNYYPEDIADGLGIDYLNGQGGYDYDIVDALDIFYGVWSREAGTYKPADIERWIDRDKPIIGHWDEINGYMDHAVPIVGYYTDSDAIVIAESLNGYVGYRKVNTTNGKYQYSLASGRTYRYVASVILKW